MLLMADNLVVEGYEHELLWSDLGFGLVLEEDIQWTYFLSRSYFVLLALCNIFHTTHYKASQLILALQLG